MSNTFSKRQLKYIAKNNIHNFGYRPKDHKKDKNIKYAECCVCYNDKVPIIGDNMITCGKSVNYLCSSCKITMIDMNDTNCPLCRSHEIKKPIFQEYPVKIYNSNYTEKKTKQKNKQKKLKSLSNKYRKRMKHSIPFNSYNGFRIPPDLVNPYHIQDYIHVREILGKQRYDKQFFWKKYCLFQEERIYRIVCNGSEIDSTPATTTLFEEHEITYPSYHELNEEEIIVYFD